MTGENLAAASAEPLRGMRRVIARRMRASLHDMAQLTLHRTIETQALLALREDMRRNRVTVNDVILAGVVAGIGQFPTLNSTLEDDVVYRWDTINLGVAVSVADGLVVPVIKEAQLMSLEEISAESRRLATLAHAKSLDPSEMSGGTFTVSNLGAFGIDGFTPIVNPPEVAILGVGAARERGATLSLTVDHSAIDGVLGARFLDCLADLLEDPNELQCLLQTGKFPRKETERVR